MEMTTNPSPNFKCSKLTQDVRIILEKLNPKIYLNGNCRIKIEHGTAADYIGTSSGLKTSPIHDMKFQFSHDNWSQGAYENPNSVVKSELDGSEEDEDDESIVRSSNDCGLEKTLLRKRTYPKIQCLICKINFACKGNFIRHHKLKHRKLPLPAFPPSTHMRASKYANLIDPSNPLKCMYCHKVFNQTQSLRVHIRIHRPPGMEYYACQFCGQRFIHRGSWKKHLSKHAEQPAYSCKKCEFTTRYRTSIFHHEKICYKFRHQDDMVRKNRQLFYCDLCGKPFKSEIGVYNHKIVTDGNCKVFACRICGKKFYRESLFREHETVAHTDEFPFPCPLCDSKFKVRAGLTCHTRNAHTHWSCKRVGCTVAFLTKSDWRRHLKNCLNPIICTVCEQIFESSEEFSAHTHPIQCDKCEKTYPKKSQMDFHLGYHDPLNVFKCENCTFGYGSCGELTTHLKLNHKNDNQILANFIVRSADDIYYFTCKFCDVELEDPSSSVLLEHCKSLHSDKIGKFICPNCGRGFQEESKCFFHRNRIHGAVETDFKCEICILYFLTKHGLDVHISKSHYQIPLVDMAVTIETSENSKQPETCLNLDRFSCLICGKKCLARSNLGRHMTLHRMDNEFKCELCVRSWKRSDGLNTHNRTRHPDLELETAQDKIIECPFCDRTFKQQANFKVHFRMHTKEKPFECQICDKRFANSDSLTRHMLVHSGEKSKSCDFCDAVFARNAERAKHIKRFHKIDS